MAVFFAAMIELATAVIAFMVFLAAGSRTTGATDSDRANLCLILGLGTGLAFLVFAYGASWHPW